MRTHRRHMHSGIFFAVLVGGLCVGIVAVLFPESVADIGISTMPIMNAGFVAIALSMLGVGMLSRRTHRFFELSVDPYIGIAITGLLVVGIVSTVFSGAWFDGTVGDLFTAGTIGALVAALVLASIRYPKLSSVQTAKLLVGSIVAAGVITGAAWWQVITGTYAFTVEGAIVLILFAIPALGFVVFCRDTVPSVSAVVFVVLFSIFLWVGLFAPIPIAVVALVFLLGTVAMARLRSGSRWGLGLVLVGVITIGMFVQGVAGLSRMEAATISPNISLPVVQTAFVDALPAPFVGTGPGSLTAAWFTHRSEGVNHSPWWDVAITTTGIGSIDFLLMFGVLGLSLFVVIWGRVMMVGMRTFGALGRYASDRSLALFTLAGTSMLGVTFLLVSVPLTGVLLVVGLALGVQQSYFPELSNSVYRSPALPHSIVRISGLVTLFVAVWIFSYGLFVGFAGVLSPVAVRALTPVFPHDDTVRREGAALLGSLADADSEESFATGARQTIFFADRATELNQHDMRAWLVRGSIYAQLNILGVQETESRAARSFERARNIAPDHPTVYALWGRFEIANGNRDSAREKLSRAIVLRPGHTQAYELLRDDSFDTQE